MAILIFGVLLFSLAHLIPVARRDLRERAVARIGEIPWKLAMAAALVLSVVLMAQGYAAAGRSPVDIWYPPAWTRHLNNLLMLIAIGVYVAGAAKGTLSRRIRHPQLTGVKIWAVAHLLVNGDLGALVLFGGLLAWAVVTLILTNKRDGAWVRPPAGPRSRDLLHVGLTLAGFVLVALVHNWLGVYPFPG